MLQQCDVVFVLRPLTPTSNVATFLQKHDVDALCLSVLKIKVTLWKLWNIQGGVPKNVCIIYMYICISIADTITLNIKNSNNHNKHKDTNPLRYLSHLFNDTWPYIKFICISMYIRFFWHPLYIYIKYILLKCVFVRLCMPNAYAWGYCIFLQKLCMNPMMSFSECALYLFLLCVCKIILPCWWWCSPTCYIWYRLYFIAN